MAAGAGICLYGRRIRFTSVVLAALTVLPAALASAASLPPDLMPVSGSAVLCQEKRSVIAKRDACTGRGRTVIRTTTTTADIGPGPLELAPVVPRADVPEDCHGNGDVDIDGDGRPDDDDILVRQRVYGDRNGDGVFERATDTSSASRILGCRYYHPIHRHYHLEGFAEFLVADAQTGDVVARANKISFCVEDSDPFDLALPGAQPPSRSKEGFYSYESCASRRSVQGMSVGWADAYRWKTPGQEIDVGNLDAGDYCVVTVADPDNQVRESNEANNVSAARYHIDPTLARVGSPLTLKLSPGSCATPLD